MAIKWLLPSTSRAWAAAKLNRAKYYFNVSPTFCLIFARDEASGLIVLAAQNCFLKSEDNYSHEVVECLLNLSNQLLAGPVKVVGNNIHLSSTFTLVALITTLKVLRWLPGSVVPSYEERWGSLNPCGNGVLDILGSKGSSSSSESSA